MLRQRRGRSRHHAVADRTGFAASAVAMPRPWAAGIAPVVHADHLAPEGVERQGSTSCQRCITSSGETDRRSRPGGAGDRSTICAASGLAITFGAYCGSISDVEPAQQPVEAGADRRAAIEHVIPANCASCHSTRSGFSAITA